jgi:hypothetical protein
MNRAHRGSVPGTVPSTPDARRRLSNVNFEPGHRHSSPQGLRPEIARIIEELARAALRREDRRAIKGGLRP